MEKNHAAGVHHWSSHLDDTGGRKTSRAESLSTSSCKPSYEPVVVCRTTESKVRDTLKQIPRQDEVIQRPSGVLSAMEPAAGSVPGVTFLHHTLGVFPQLIPVFRLPGFLHELWFGSS